MDLNEDFSESCYLMATHLVKFQLRSQLNTKNFCRRLSVNDQWESSNESKQLPFNFSSSYLGKNDVIAWLFMIEENPNSLTKKIFFLEMRMKYLIGRGWCKHCTVLLWFGVIQSVVFMCTEGQSHQLSEVAQVEESVHVWVRVWVR